MFTTVSSVELAMLPCVGQIRCGDAVQELAHIGAPPQALITGATLRSHIHQDAIAHLYSPDFWTDRF